MQGQMTLDDWLMVPAKEKECSTCNCFGQVVDAYTCERLGFRACFKYEAWSQNMNKNNGKDCRYWEEKA